jgi:hypothetical protein
MTVMGTYRIENTGVNPQMLETILTDIYSRPVTRSCRPTLLFTPKTGAATELSIDWLGHIDKLELNKETLRKQIQKLLQKEGQLIIESPLSRRRR